MSDSGVTKNRLLLDMDRRMRNINQEVINPEIPELAIDDLEPTMQLVAQLRSEYLKLTIAIAKKASEGSSPSQENIQELRIAREQYEELTAGFQALEAAIKRGYLDVAG